MQKELEALIVTCQIDPMNGEVWDASEKIAESSECRVFDKFMPSEDDRMSFIRSLLIKTDCIKEPTEIDGELLIEPSILHEVAVSVFKVHIQERLFSQENIKESGKFYSPRVAIKKQKAKREFENPRNKDKEIRSYRFLQTNL